MQVILTKDVPDLGSIGSLIKVKGGYARNYLLPRSFAVIANDSNIKEIEHYKRVLGKKKEKILKEWQTQASKLEKLTLKVVKQVGEEDKIFGSVTTSEISELFEKEGFKLSRRQLQLPENLKVTGKYEVTVRLHPEVSCKVKFEVIAS